jgi:hypothetical protein
MYHVPVSMENYCRGDPDQAPPQGIHTQEIELPNNTHPTTAGAVVNKIKYQTGLINER